MNVNINDENFKNSKAYMDFLANNPGEGYLKIRASSTNQAMPISGLKIIVSTIIGNDNVIFFEGVTNESGVIKKISLPTPKSDKDDLIAPKSITYDIEAIAPNNTKSNFQVKMYDGINVIQNINVVPNMSGGF